MEKIINKGLYIHIPFCRKKCDYCDFYSLSGSERLIPYYVNAILKEASSYENYPIDTLYIGGGTPSLLGKGVRRLVDGLKSIFKFDLEEATVEANPESCSDIFLESALNAGINRISIGVQSLNDDELSSVGRIHDSKEALNAIYRSKKIGFKGISVDVIIGLPGQDWHSLRKTLSILIDARIGQISTYCLSIERNTPLFSNIPYNLPTEDNQASLYTKTKTFLETYGFKHIEISSFSLPGHEPIHNLNCWRGRDYIGLGAGASSFIDGVRFSNKKGLSGYISNPCSRGSIDEELNETERAEDEAMLRLRMLDEGLDLNVMRVQYNTETIRTILDRILKLEDEGLLVSRNNKYLIPSDKILTSNSIFQRILYGD
jgi:oxygen-independent coproporphyrinogen III oxidase